MKILLVSWYFPPCSTMGALRVGKFAKYLVGEGHDVRIVCAKDQPYAMDHPVEVPEDFIYRTIWRDINWLPASIQRVRAGIKSLLSGKTRAPGVGAQDAPPAAANTPHQPNGILRLILNFYQNLTNIPDGMIGWLLPALRAGRKATKGWKPDVVFASAPPFTTLIAGRIIAKRAKAPLVIEYRDRWIEDPYGLEDPKFRQWLDRRIEEWCARPAVGVVTVSDPWAEDYRQRWGKPVAVAYNGFDPDDVAKLDDVPPSGSDKLKILYTGIIYPERRDPTPLFEALSRLGARRDEISVDFYGANVGRLEGAVAGHAQQDIVSLRPGIPFAEALKLQRQADVLLLLQWNDPLEAGNVPGKLFEYLAARRPVLGIGFEQGVPARILRERNAGRVLNDPDQIAAYLTELLDQKKRNGSIDLLPADVSAGLSRPEQYRHIERMLGDAGQLRADAR